MSRVARAKATTTDGAHRGFFYILLAFGVAEEADLLAGRVETVRSANGPTPQNGAREATSARAFCLGVGDELRPRGAEQSLAGVNAAGSQSSAGRRMARPLLGPHPVGAFPLFCRERGSERLIEKEGRLMGGINNER